jgi:CBS domain-containing protein
MSREVIACTPATDLARVGWLLWEGDCGALPVVEEGRVLGMITDRDLALAAAMKPRPCVEIHVGEVVTLGDVSLARPEASLEEALALMERARVRRLAVVNAEGALIGMISLSDLVRTAGATGIPAHRILSALQSLSEPRMRSTI